MVRSVVASGGPVKVDGTITGNGEFGVSAGAYGTCVRQGSVSLIGTRVLGAKESADRRVFSRGAARARGANALVPAATPSARFAVGSPYLSCGAFRSAIAPPTIARKRPRPETAS